VFRKHLIAIIMLTFAITWIVITHSNVIVFAEDNCSSGDSIVCAQTGLSIPAPAEHGIVSSSKEKEESDQAKDQGQQYNLGINSDSNSKGDPFILPFP
jgi:hypothetical protein